MSSDEEIDGVEALALISKLQSIRDRMMLVLPKTYGEGFDGDMDTLLEAINHLKRARRLRPQVTEEMVERVWMAATGRTRYGKAYEGDAKCMTAEERADVRAALTAALEGSQK